MFGDGYFSFSFPEFVGTIVTIVGIWLIVKQLRETKLASQMEGLLELLDQWTASQDTRRPVLNLIDLEEWDRMNDKDAYARIYESGELLKGYTFIVNWYELTSVLVRNKALDKTIVFEYFGGYIVRRWNKFEKVVRHHRLLQNDFSINNWEWLAKEFEDYPG